MNNNWLLFILPAERYGWRYCPECERFAVPVYVLNCARPVTHEFCTSCWLWIRPSIISTLCQVWLQERLKRQLNSNFIFNLFMAPFQMLGLKKYANFFIVSGTFKVIWLWPQLRIMELMRTSSLRRFLTSHKRSCQSSIRLRQSITTWLLAQMIGPVRSVVSIQLIFVLASMLRVNSTRYSVQGHVISA